MDNKNKKSKIWAVLYYLCFAAVIISTAILIKQYRGYQNANNQYEEMQAGVSVETKENIEATEPVYIKKSVQKTLEENAVSAAPEEILTAKITNRVNPLEAAMKELQKAAMQNNAAEGLSGAGTTGSLSGTGTAEGLSGAGASEGLSGIGVSEGLNATDAAGDNAADSKSYNIEIPQKTIDWDALHEQNADIYAWIYVPDTKVDYPILQHPTDNSYYLNYNIDGTKGFPGCIYTENYNKKDFSDVHTVIYGHNLKDKTMFTSLHNFEDDELFAQEHYIYIYTPDYTYVYRIFAAYEFSSIHLLDNYDFTNEYVYEDFLKKIYNTTDLVANVKQDIKVTTKDKIVTLSTCKKNRDASKRFLVTGVLINPKE